jgi:hypothetical protein
MVWKMLVSTKAAHSLNLITGRYSWFMSMLRMDNDELVFVNSDYYGILIGFRNYEIKQQYEQGLVEYLANCNDTRHDVEPLIFDEEYLGVERHSTNRPVLRIANSDEEWFLLQCKYPDIIRVY